MESIAVTKPDIGVLSRDRLPLSPFGMLAQAFAEELLARSGWQEGAWSFVPLDLLEETEPSAAFCETSLHLDLRLVLEALRRDNNRSEQQRTVERIVERVLRLQREPSPSSRRAGSLSSHAALRTARQ